MQGGAEAPARATLDAGGLRLRALVWPALAPLAPPLLWLHATSFCAEVWEPVARAAQAAGAPPASALATDARGHGASDAPPAAQAYAWTRLVEDVVAWIDALPSLLPNHGDPAVGVVLVGHSSGATTALAAASQRPAQVRGVVAVEPVLFDPPPPGADADGFRGSRFMAAQALRRRGRFESLDDARARLTARPPYAGFAPPSLEAFLAGGLGPAPDGGLALRCTPEVEAACYDGAAALDLWPALGRILCPVRLVAGDPSFMPPSLVERLVDRLPGTSVEAIGGGTHFVALEQPAAVGAAVARFLREVTPSRVA
jgi:pimeloyl-ACP methyl ester carboxylesterase